MFDDCGLFTHGSYLRTIPSAPSRRDQALRSTGGGRTEDRGDTPGGHHQADDDQEHDPSSTELPGGIGRPLAPTMFPPGEAVPDDERQTQTEDHLGEDGVEAQDLEHTATVAWR